MLAEGTSSTWNWKTSTPMFDNFSVGSHTSLQNKAITRIFGFKGLFLKYTIQFVLVKINGIKIITMIMWKIEDGWKPAGSIDHMGNPELPHVSNSFNLLGWIKDVFFWRKKIPNEIFCNVVLTVFPLAKIRPGNTFKRRTCGENFCELKERRKMPW